MTIAHFLPLTGKVRAKLGVALGVAVSSRAVSLLLSSHVFCLLFQPKSLLMRPGRTYTLHYTSHKRGHCSDGVCVLTGTQIPDFSCTFFKPIHFWFFFGKPQLCLVREIKPSLSVGSVLGEDRCWELVLLMPVVFYCQANCNA